MKSRKIFSILLTAFFIGVSHLAYSIGEEEASKPSTNHATILIDQAKTMIKYPDFARDQKISGFVSLSFSYDAQGDFKVNELNTNSLELSEYVISELENLKICPWGKSAQNEYIIRFNFKML
ncbi:MAG: hypothetical protein RBS19_07760 [Bacteroidales bacterium]|nr:hypothetical protein [Bacteroidales bacterium]